MSTVKTKKKAELERKRALRAEKKTEVREQKYLMTLAYDGAKFGGYAKQKHKNTVQNILELALKQQFGVDIKTTEASRTDAKVHGLDQKVMFTLPHEISAKKVMASLNEQLPREIQLGNLESVPSDFHCRHDVLHKTYEYVISKTFDIRQINYSWLVEQQLDVEKMIHASRCLIGRHDFSTFKSAKATTETSVRTIRFLDIKETATHIYIRINADGFLYNMVRLIVKALVDVGTGKKDENYIEQLLLLKEKPDNLESAPAGGLCLMGIFYE